MLSKTKIWNGSAWVKARAKIYSSGAWKTVIQGSGLNQITFDAIAPSDLALTVINDTSIKLDFTVNSTGQDGHSIERSTDGTNYAAIGTVSGATATYTDTTGADGTRYYYRVKAYAGAVYSDPCTAANDWCAIKMVLTSRGNGTGVSTIRFWFETIDVVATLDGAGKWYSDSGGTADESASYTFVAGALRTRYLKVTSGTSNMLIFAKNNMVAIGNNVFSGWVTTTNAPNISGNIERITSLIILRLDSECYITGSLAALKNLTYISLGYNNSVSGDIGGNGTEALVYGITYLYIKRNYGLSEYTSGATWSLTNTTSIETGVGYGYSATEIDNMLIDMAASLGTVVSKTITSEGTSEARTTASDAAVTTLNGKGWTIVTT